MLQGLNAPEAVSGGNHVTIGDDRASAKRALLSAGRALRLTYVDQHEPRPVSLFRVMTAEYLKRRTAS